MGYFLLWEIFRMSRVFTTTMLRSTSLFLTHSHKIRQYLSSTRCVLSLKRKGATGTAELRILSQFIHSVNFKNNLFFVWFYCILMFNCTVSNATLSPKSSMATPGRTRSSRGHRTLSTRLHMVSMSRASESLVGAWANSCRVRGRLSLLMMARTKSSKACSIGSISGEQVGHGTSTSPYASRNSFTAAAIYGQT